MAFLHHETVGGTPCGVGRAHFAALVRSAVGFAQQSHALRRGANAAGGAFASVSSGIHCNSDGVAADSLLRGTFADDIMSVRESNPGGGIV